MTGTRLWWGGIQLENSDFRTYLEKSEALPAEVDHVVWPEYALPYDVRKNPLEWRKLLAFCRERNVTMTVGTQTHPDDGKWRNVALTLDGAGLLGEHTKNHPVHFFVDGEKGSSALPVETPHGRMGTPICFDCDYEGVVRRMTAAGAEVFVIPVMDAEAWTARQHDQHAELFRIRASENGRWLFSCATSGVSQVIDPRGHVHARLGALEQGTLVGRITKESGMTFYTRYGWLAPWMILGAMMVWNLVVLWRTFRRNSV